MTRVGITFFSLLVLGALAVGYFLGAGLPKNAPPPGSNIAVVPAPTDGMEVAVAHVDEETPFAVAHAEYPQFPTLDPAFNASIKDLVVRAIGEHKQASEANWTARARTSTDGSIPAVPPKDQRFELVVSWEHARIDTRYISVLVRIGGYNGGAHGFENVTTFNYDVAGKRVLRLADLFPNDPDYLATVASTSIAQLKFSIAEKMGGTLGDDGARSIEDGASAKEEHYSAFTFTDRAITVYFAQYQVGPYVIGMPTVSIARKE